MFCRFVLSVGLVIGLAACSPDLQQGPDFDKQAIFDTVDAALTVGNCKEAVSAIEPIYHSSQSDNEVRLKAAAAYGCYADINFFKLLGELGQNAASIATGSGFWSTMAKLFSSVQGSDYIPEGGLFGIDALQAVLKPGALVLSAFQVNAGSNNIGSVLYTDRTADSNIYLTFMSMAALGGLASRHGDPDPSTHIKRQSLPWVQYTQMTPDSEGCALVSSMFNSLDAMQGTGQAIGGSVQAAFQTVTTILTAAYDLACIAGCSGVNDTTLNNAFPGFLKKPNDPTTGNNGWVATGCSGVGLVCAGCPTELRDRRKCTGELDQYSCAAAGMINFLNAGIIGWN